MVPDFKQLIPSDKVAVHLKNGRIKVYDRHRIMMADCGFLDCASDKPPYYPIEEWLDWEDISIIVFDHHITKKTQKFLSDLDIDWQIVRVI